MIRGAYAGAGWRDRLHVAGRLRSCPFDAVLERVPASGRVLDVGCGHGVFSLLLARAGPQREVLGIDLDEHKLAVARDAATAAGIGNVRFEPAVPDAVPGGPFAAVCIVDVLYLLGRDAAESLLIRLADLVEPGGVVLVKEMDTEPRWKYHLTRLQELAATRVLRITEGTSVEIVPPATIAAGLERSGLAVEHVPLGRGRLHPHHLVVGHRNPSNSTQ